MLKTLLLTLSSAAIFASSAFAADLDTPAAPRTDPSLAASYRLFIQAGLGGVILSPSANITVGGAGVAGASIKATNSLAAVANIGYFLTPDWSVTVTLANPPTTSVSATGTLAGVGKLGTATYPPPVLAVQYHFRQFGAFQPYVGAGVNYTIILGSSDAALTNFRVRSNLGAAVQTGADYMIDNHWGLFLDVKHIWWNSTAAGNLGATLVTAKVTLDPAVVSGGIAYRL